MLINYMTEIHLIPFEAERCWHLTCPSCERIDPLTVQFSVSGYPLIWHCPGCNRFFLRVTPATPEEYDHA